MEAIKIIWTQQAKSAVKDIYSFHKKKSLQGAKNVLSDILESPKSIAIQNNIS